MLIKSEFDIQFHFAHPTAMVAMLHLHPPLERYVRSGNVLVIEHLDDGAGFQAAPGYGRLIGSLAVCGARWAAAAQRHQHHRR